MLSSDNLYHFTPKFEYLQLILKSKKLRVSYCLEDYTWTTDFGIPFATIWSDKKVQKEISVAIPMTCFCDIPSNLVKSHTEIYGRFGLGFKEDLKLRLALNPMFYLSSRSSATSLIQTIKVCADRISTDNPEYAIRNQLYKLLAYCKPYKGRFEKSGTIYENHRFYDEKEWRYVIPEDFHRPLTKVEYDSLKDKCIEYLRFKTNEIKVVIVENQYYKDELSKLYPRLKIETIDEFMLTQK